MSKLAAQWRAVGTQAAWDALSAAEQALYAGGHFLDYTAAFSALPATFTSDIWLKPISEVTTTLTASVSVDCGGNTLYVGNTDYKWYDNCSFDGAIVSATNGKVDFNVDSKQITTKNNTTFAFIKCNSAIAVSINGEIDINNYTNNAIYSNDDACTFDMYSLIIKNCANIIRTLMLYKGLLITIENLTMINCTTGIKNYAAIGTFKIYNSFVTSLIDVPPDDYEKVLTEDASSPEVASRNKVATDCFEDPANDNFMPKDIADMRSTKAPTIAENTTSQNGITWRPPVYWVGAWGRPSGFGSRLGSYIGIGI